MLMRWRTARVGFGLRPRDIECVILGGLCMRCRRFDSEGLN